MRQLFKNGDVVEVTLELHKGSLSKRFRTRNTLHRCDAMDLALIGGPFKQLSGGWRFQQLWEEGSKVALKLEFEFDSRMLDMVIGAYFEDICNKLVDAFTRRATVIYGCGDASVLPDCCGGGVRSTRCTNTCGCSITFVIILLKH